MSDPFLGEIKPVAFNFAPRGWALCNGQLLPINQNMALFALLGTTYGGNGQTNFALPDLRARVPLHFSSSYSQGSAVGQNAVTLNTSQLPAHEHTAQATTSAAATSLPAGAAPAVSAKDVYVPSLQAAAVAMAPTGAVGGSQPHPNQMPSCVLNFCIALQGIFPSQT